MPAFSYQIRCCQLPIRRDDRWRYGMNRVVRVTAAGGIALGLVFGAGVTAANADEAQDSAEVVFDEFVDALKVNETTDAALTQKFDRLPDPEQERLADAI